MDKIENALLVLIASAIKNFNRIRTQTAFESQITDYIKLFLRKFGLKYDFFHN